MNHRTTVRATTTATRGVWALLAVLWLNMAVLPCAMAFEKADDDCPHCPPADEHEMAAHHGHGDQQAAEPCATLQSECCDVATASVDSRAGKLALEKSADVESFALPAFAVSATPHSACIAAATDPPDIVGSSPPLHVLYCVYLD